MIVNEPTAGEHEFAQPKISILPLALSDVDEVSRLERRCFALAWSPSAYVTEIGNPSAYYVVARTADDTIIGYAGMWVIMDEAHLTTVAVEPAARGRKIGERLLHNLLITSIARGAERATLEVRETNSVAHNLYLKYKFADVALRKNYYSDNRENAIIMWANDMTSVQYREMLLEYGQRLDNVEAQNR